MIRNIILLLVASLTIIACNQKYAEVNLPYSEKDFTKEIEGGKTSLYRLQNEKGMVVMVTNYGARLVSIYAPDKRGQLADVLLGFRRIKDYIDDKASHGATIAPYANRISNGSFRLDDNSYLLPINDINACLHSGNNSSPHQIWRVVNQTDNSISMSLFMKNGVWGFPGDRMVTVSYTLTDNDALRIDYQATTNQSTVFNLTNHSYFNLKGEGNGDISDHEVMIDADKATKIDKEMIPTGEIVSILGTDLDFTKSTSISERVDSKLDQIEFGRGLDNNFVLNNPVLEHLSARVVEPESGRVLEVYTSEPGIQFYTGNYLDGKIGKSKKSYQARSGFCLETQHFPDSPNHDNFPSTRLNPTDTIHSTTIYRFCTTNDI
ncbi:MAG: aldose epimerase family protein [Bacteroidales bacterium]